MFGDHDWISCLEDILPRNTERRPKFYIEWITALPRSRPRPLFEVSRPNHVKIGHHVNHYLCWMSYRKLPYTKQHCFSVGYRIEKTIYQLDFVHRSHSHRRYHILHRIPHNSFTNEYSVAPYLLIMCYLCWVSYRKFWISSKYSTFWVWVGEWVGAYKLKGKSLCWFTFTLYWGSSSCCN